MDACWPDPVPFGGRCCAVHLSLFSEGVGGTIAAKNKRRYEFVAENGVRVWLKKKEKAEMQGVYDLLRTRTKPGEYVVCYPYAPTINFFANRPSYEYNLYIDNATAGADFHRETLAELARYAPAAIVIDNREINKNDASQFSQWAADTYEYIRSHYYLGGTFGRQEVYLRDARPRFREPERFPETRGKFASFPLARWGACPVGNRDESSEQSGSTIPRRPRQSASCWRRVAGPGLSPFLRLAGACSSRAGAFWRPRYLGVHQSRPFLAKRPGFPAN